MTTATTSPAHASRPTTALLVAALALAACDGRPSSQASPPPAARVERSDRHIAVLDLRHGAPEQAGGGVFGGPPESTLAHLVVALRDMPQEDDLAGVFVRLGAGNTPLAQAEEIGDLLSAVRQQHKVVCHADVYTNSTILLAARACDEVWLSPAGNVNTIGLAGQLIFGRTLLERLQVDVDFLQVGDFKGASEPFTRDSASPQARQSLEQALSGLRHSWLDGVSKARPGNSGELGLEDGPYTAEEALQHKLIDTLGFEHEARRHLLEMVGAEGFSDYFGGQPEHPSGLGEWVSTLAAGGRVAGPHIAVVLASGAIALEAGGGLGSGGINARDLATELARVRENGDALAVVLRIDSPGGSALASDLLWHELMRLREVKPLVVSVGGMAASGGYYLACAGQKIVAEPTSIIGSIGVVSGKLSFARSLKEVGISVETVPANPNASPRALYASPFVAWDEATRQRMHHTAERIYDLFLERIGSGRNMRRADIEPFAAGRIMGGRRAKEAHLIDELGGLDRALVLARQLAKIGPDDDVAVRIMHPPSALLSLLGLSAEQAAAQAQQRAQLQRQLRRAWRPMLSQAPHFQRLSHHGERFISSFLPLVAGESSVAALPYALIIE